MANLFHCESLRISLRKRVEKANMSSNFFHLSPSLLCLAFVWKASF